MKWRFEEGTGYGDRWTRGKDALPVYEEAAAHPRVPEYAVDYNAPPTGEPVASVTPPEYSEAQEIETGGTRQERFHEEQRAFLQHRGMSVSAQPTQAVVSTDPATFRAPRDANGQTSRFENKKAPKLGWKGKLSKGFEGLSGGGGG